MANDDFAETESALAANTEHIPGNSVSSSEGPSSPVRSCPPEEFAPIRTTPSGSPAESTGPRLDDDGVARTISQIGRAHV